MGGGGGEDSSWRAVCGVASIATAGASAHATCQARVSRVLWVPFSSISALFSIEEYTYTGYSSRTQTSLQDLLLAPVLIWRNRWCPNPMHGHRSPFRSPLPPQRPFAAGRRQAGKAGDKEQAGMSRIVGYAGFVPGKQHVFGEKFGASAAESLRERADANTANSYLQRPQEISTERQEYGYTRVFAS